MNNRSAGLLYLNQGCRRPESEALEPQHPFARTAIANSDAPAVTLAAAADVLTVRVAVAEGR